MQESLFQNNKNCAVIHNDKYYVVIIKDGPDICYETYAKESPVKPIDSGAANTKDITTVQDMLNVLFDNNVYGLDYDLFEQELKIHEDPEGLVDRLYEIRAKIKAFTKDYLGGTRWD